MPDTLKSGARESALEETLLQLVTERGAGKTICPSEVARAVASDDTWRSLLGPIRTVAVELARRGEVVITRKGKPVDPERFKGVYRIGVPSGNGKPGDDSGP